MRRGRKKCPFEAVILVTFMLASQSFPIAGLRHSLCLIKCDAYCIPHDSLPTQWLQVSIGSMMEGQPRVLIPIPRAAWLSMYNRVHSDSFIPSNRLVVSVSLLYTTCPKMLWRLGPTPNPGSIGCATSYLDMSE